METKWISEIPKYHDIEGYTINTNGEVWSYLKKRRNELGRIIGTITSDTGQKIKGSLDSKGYRYIHVRRKDGTRVCPKIHRLVALAFLPNDYEKPQINHIDGDKTNNRVENLEWCTNSENQLHAYNLGLNKPRYGKYNYQWDSKAKNNQPVIQKDEEGNEINRFNSIAQASRSIGCGRSNIANALRSKSHYAKGYYWYKG